MRAASSLLRQTAVLKRLRILPALCLLAFGGPAAAELNCVQRAGQLACQGSGADAGQKFEGVNPDSPMGYFVHTGPRNMLENEPVYNDDILDEDHLP
jgi:hypothetical protein